MKVDFTKMRPLYRHAELDCVLNPKSIAVVGASPKAGSFGDRVLANLAGFDGDIYLVNSKTDSSPRAHILRRLSEGIMQRDWLPMCPYSGGLTT